ncbi:MAG: FKBP-type peptidyl-prolyl cis-trans isomerase [Vicinamibacterales bacterium]
MKRILILIGTVALAATLSACSNSNSPSTTTTGSNGVSSITTLQTTDVRVGTGADAVVGRAVTVHYTGWLYSESASDHHGTKFDSSVDRNVPYTFILGAGTVIKGWDQGIVGMKVGGQRTLVIPPSLGYGSTGVSGVIPANATLIFDVQLLGVN